MSLLFLPFHILLNLPSLLPSLPAPSIWQAAARKPGCIHNSSSKHQLIIRPAITHLSTIPSIDFEHSDAFLYFICTAQAPVTEAMASCRPCKAISSCSIYPLDWNCVLIREMMGQVFWYSFMSVRSLIPLHSNLQAWQRAVVSGSLFCSTPNWGNLLS